MNKVDSKCNRLFCRSNSSYYTLRNSSTDYVWTLAWEVTVPVPVHVATTLEFRHSGGGSGSADVAIDNIEVVGGYCGTSSACTCGAGRKYAGGGQVNDNHKAHMYLVETKDSIAPGYADNAELTCAHCGKQDESSWVGKNISFNLKNIQIKPLRKQKTN